MKKERKLLHPWGSRFAVRGSQPRELATLPFSKLISRKDAQTEIADAIVAIPQSARASPMDWKHHLEETSASLSKFRSLRPEVGAGFTALHRAAMNDGAMTQREKELIALGIGISKQCVDCIGFHVQAAVKAGASREDIADTISVAVMMGGGPAYMYGVKALESYDQLIA